MRRPLLALVLLALASCQASDATPEGAYLDHGVPEDLIVDADTGAKTDAFPSAFDAARIMSDPFFTNATAVTADDIQAFLEANPYGDRSWLADATVGDRSVAQVVADVAREESINPIVLLARIQVGKGLVSRTTAITGHAWNYAFGCGCHDGEDCMAQFKGFDNQIRCATQVLVTSYTASRDGSGQWRKGKAKKTLDGVSVTPFNHASAALYAYTPWVLRGEGGNWLVWNVTRRFARHFEAMGALDLDDPLHDDAWIGRPCLEHEACDFEKSGIAGFCLVFTPLGAESPAGLCSYPCEGYCPDLQGAAPTFCVSEDGENGFCTVRAEESNGWCAEIPGTEARDTPRFIGGSSAGDKISTVCMPAR